MRTFCTVIGASLALALSTSAFAQERHVVTADTLAQTVSQYVTKQDADRATIRETLARPEVKNVAERVGIDIEPCERLDRRPPARIARACRRNCSRRQSGPRRWRIDDRDFHDDHYHHPADCDSGGGPVACRAVPKSYAARSTSKSGWTSSSMPIRTTQPGDGLLQVVGNFVGKSDVWREVRSGLDRGCVAFVPSGPTDPVGRQAYQALGRRRVPGCCLPHRSAAAVQTLRPRPVEAIGPVRVAVFHRDWP